MSAQEKMYSNVKIFGLTQEEHHRIENDIGGECVDDTDRPKFVINPTSDFMKRWDIFQAVVLFYLSMTVPIRVGFGVQAMGAGYVIDLFVDIYFWADIVVNFFKGYEDASGLIVYDYSKIRKNYMSSWFSLDLVASLPIDLAFRLGEGEFLCSISSSCLAKEQKTDGNEGQLFRLFKLFRLVRLVKMLRLVRLQRLLERYQDELFDLMPTIKMCKLVFILILLGHIFGCFFYFFSNHDWRTEGEIESLKEGKISVWMHSEFSEESSLNESSDAAYFRKEAEIENTMLGERYIASMYWAFTTMTTVGYGDISAITISERAFAMVGMLVGGFAFSAMIGSISTVFASRDLSKQAGAKKIDLVSAFVRDRHMQKQLRMQVLGFFRKQQVVAYDERVFLQQMPYQIRAKVLRHCYGSIVEQVPMFEGASDVFITEVLFCLDPKIFVAGVMITQKGEVGSDMYILESGDVELLEDDQVKVLKVLPAGSYFGEEICLGHSERQINVRAKANCRICCLSKEDLDPLLDQWPEIRESIKEWYNKRMDHFADCSMKGRDGDQQAGAKRVTLVAKKNHEQNIDDRLEAMEANVSSIQQQLGQLTAMISRIDAKLGGEGGTPVKSLPKIASCS